MTSEEMRDGIESEFQSRLVYNGMANVLSSPSSSIVIPSMLTLAALSIFLCFFRFIAAAANSDTLTVLTYNIRHGLGRDEVVNLERISSIISSANPDVVALQEVDFDTNRSHVIHEAQEIAKLTGMGYFFSSTMEYDGGDYGDAILWKRDRFSVDSINEFQVAKGMEPREVCCVTFSLVSSLSDFHFQFCCTHMSLWASPRLAEAVFVNEHIGSKATVPSVFCGDLNATPKSATIQELEKVWVSATNETIVTFPATNEQIDFVFVKGKAFETIVSAKAIDSKLAYEASDHYPLQVVINVVEDSDL